MNACLVGILTGAVGGGVGLVTTGPLPNIFPPGFGPTGFFFLAINSYTEGMEDGAPTLRDIVPTEAHMPMLDANRIYIWDMSNPATPISIAPTLDFGLPPVLRFMPTDNWWREFAFKLGAHPAIKHRLADLSDTDLGAIMSECMPTL